MPAASAVRVATQTFRIPSPAKFPINTPVVVVTCHSLPKQPTTNNKISAGDFQHLVVLCIHSFPDCSPSFYEIYEGILMKNTDPPSVFLRIEDWPQAEYKVSFKTHVTGKPQ